MKFSDSHEWAELTNDIAVVGVTNFGRMLLGDVINIKLPQVGKNVKKKEEVGVLESNKAAVDFHTPLSGEIIEVNQGLASDLNKLNTSPEKEGWIFKIRVKDSKEYDSLMSLEEYEKKVSK